MHLIQPLIGSQIFRFDEVSSTNDLLRSLADRGEASHGAVVTARYQSSGRGQSGNSWESERGENLLLSIQVIPSGITATDHVFLNFFAGLAVFDLISSFFPGSAKIKWPNDIYVGDKKIAGILIENSLYGNTIKNSLIGIGVNINQQNFSATRSTSFNILTGRKFDLDDMQDRLIAALNSRYDELSKQLRQKLKGDYLDVLFLKGEKANFRIGEKVIEGEIAGIDMAGRLKLKVGEEIKTFAFKEIAYI